MTGVWPLAALLLALILGPGAGPGGAQGIAPAPAPRSPEEDALSVRQRTAEYWAARVAKDYRTQWELSEPRLKGRVTAEEYGSGKGAIQYLGYEVGDAKIEGGFAKVNVKVIAKVTISKRPTQPLLRTATLEDGWVKVDGVWYRRVDQPDPNAPAPGQL